MSHDAHQDHGQAAPAPLPARQTLAEGRDLRGLYWRLTYRPGVVWNGVVYLGFEQPGREGCTVMNLPRAQAIGLARAILCHYGEK